jgi:hypothetical protein
MHLKWPSRPKFDSIAPVGNGSFVDLGLDLRVGCCRANGYNRPGAVIEIFKKTMADSVSECQT